METIKHYFSGAIAFMIFSCLFAVGMGFVQGSNAATLLLSVLLLTVLEISVSLDNAVVNAKVMSELNEKSKHWFLSWGMVIAVFGMRILFPIAIVCIAAWTDPISAVKMALFAPDDYKHAIESSHVEVMGFGAAFLLMVFLEFFINNEKEHHWIPGIERFAAYIAKFPQVQLILSIPLLFLVSLTIPKENQEFLFSSFAGMLVWYIIKGVKELLESGEHHAAAASATKLMIGTLLYLEILDASFSFDGVLAAFAITSNFIIIALGLGTGAFFVRSLTIFIVDKKKIDELVYLEHGAFWGIGWLVGVMALATYGIEVGEVWAAGIAAAFIFVAAIHSTLVKN